MRLRAAVPCLLSMLAALPTDGGAAVIVAFGDSITEGISLYDEENRGGYPRRLQNLLRDEDGFADIEVRNEGVGGETSAGGLSRIGGVVQGADTVIIMEGTNDIAFIARGQLSVESTIENLKGMAGKARREGVARAIHATIIPRSPRAAIDRRNFVTSVLNIAIREFGSPRAKEMADPLEYFINSPDMFDTLYYQGGDNVGHPNAAGFTLLAELFRDLVIGVDTIHPVRGTFEPGGSQESIKPRTTFELTLYDHGTGIDFGETSLTLGGQRVETEIDGGRRRAVLTHTTTPETVGCFARLGLISADRAEPPNVTHRQLGSYSVDGVNHIAGDVDGNCRVTGADLVAFAFAFGARAGEGRYDEALDFNNDGRINGTDLARLASNFGRSSQS